MFNLPPKRTLPNILKDWTLVIFSFLLAIKDLGYGLYLITIDSAVQADKNIAEAAKEVRKEQHQKQEQEKRFPDVDFDDL